MRWPATLALSLTLALSSRAAGQWSVSNLSVARCKLAVATMADRAFFAGGAGNLPGPVIQDVVDIYEASTDSWTVGTLSLPRYYLGSASTARYVAFAGGDLGLSGPTGRIDIFDSVTGFWSTNSLPVAVDTPGGIGVGEYFFFAGGHDGLTGTRMVQILHPKSGLWRTRKIKGGDRNLVGTACDGRRAFFVGGQSSSSPPGTDIVNIYDSETDTWDWTTMPFIRELPSATVLDGKVYISGGWFGIGFMDVYDISQGTWSSVSVPTDTARPSLTSVGPYVLHVSGVSYNNHLPGTIDLYSTLTGRWRQYDQSVATFFRNAVTIEDHTVLIAGGQLSGGSTTNVVDVLRVAPLGSPYCTPANGNSTGQSATLNAFGSPAAHEDLVTLTAAGLPAGMPSLLLTSQTQGFVPNVAGSQGNLCLGGQIARFISDLTTANGQGEAYFDPVLSAIPIGGGYQVQAGETWNFQVWYRDLNPGTTSNLTDGLSLAFQ